MQVGNFFELNTRFLSKWIVAAVAAHGASPGTIVVPVVTVSLLTLRGLDDVPARLFCSETETVCVPWIADATAVMPSAPTTVAAQMSATLRMYFLLEGVKRYWLTG